MVDYFSFEDVMKELELSEEDLKRMVSEGELRAFRDENKMKFKKEDVENLKKGRITEPTIILPSTPGGGTDETVLDLDIGQETSALSEPPARGPVRASGKRPPAPEPSESEETFIEEESGTGLSTEPLKLADEVEAAETVESETVTEEIAQPRKRTMATRSSASRARTVPMSTEDEIEKRRPNPIYTALTIAAFVLVGYSNFFVYDLLMMENGRQLQPSGLTAGLATWSLNQFWSDASWKKFHESEYTEANPPYKLESGTNIRTVPEPEKPWYNGPSFMNPDRPPSIWQQPQ
jgi:hypothetical protein